MRWGQTARGAHGGGRLALDREFPAFRTGPPKPGTPRHRRGRHRRTADGPVTAQGTPAQSAGPAPGTGETRASSSRAAEVAGLQGGWPALRFSADERGIGVCDEFGAEVARGGSVAQVQEVLRRRVLAGMGSQFPRAGTGRM